jgi:hypothetical protein
VLSVFGRVADEAALETTKSTDITQVSVLLPISLSGSVEIECCSSSQALCLTSPRTSAFVTETELFLNLPAPCAEITLGKWLKGRKLQS